MTIAITGATGKLGNFVIKHLLKKLPANQIVAVVRNTEKAASLSSLGVEIRYGNYMDPASLVKAFSGISKLLLISSPDAFDETLRMIQHANVIRGIDTSRTWSVQNQSRINHPAFIPIS